MEDITVKENEWGDLCSCVEVEARKGRGKKRVKQVVLILRLDPCGDQVGLYHSGDASCGKYTLPQGCVIQKDYKKARDPRIPADILRLATERVLRQKLDVSVTEMYYLASFRCEKPDRVVSDNIEVVDYHVMITIAREHKTSPQKEGSKHQWLHVSHLESIFGNDVDHQFMSKQKKDMILSALKRFAAKSDELLDCVHPRLRHASWIRRFRELNDSVKAA
ncbi:hypothetical protein KTR10_01245 [Candidatus Kaiserbacteria bacterium]|nr:hypothetical protein [Candidatus Kaiserbacteria bacterium]